MSVYQISLDVVRKANARMKGGGSIGAQGRAATGEVVLSVDTGLGVRKFTITSEQIRAAYKKALAVVNAKEI